MSKIAILTFQNTTNYGALLQAVALQKVLRDKCGVECETLRYRCVNIEKRELPQRPQMSSNMKSIIQQMCLYLSKRKKKKNMQCFEKLLQQSERVYDRDNIADADTEYDKFIVGSDIVWELTVTGGDFTYYLDFTSPDKRFSYAASFGGNTIANECRSICQELLAGFKSISVRETSGKKLVEDLVHKEAVVSLDPTLLLTKSEWLQLCDWKPLIDNYLLIYFLDKNSNMMEYAQEIANKRNLKIVVIHDGYRKFPGVRNERFISVEHFLGWLQHATVVVTASYHGMIFSVNFEREFYYYNRAHGERMTSIAKMLGLEQLEIRNDAFPRQHVPDYAAAKRVLEAEREKSINYLRSICEK